MSLLFNNWLEEGYYEEDDMGNLNKIDDPTKVQLGKLYYNDGIATTLVNENDDIV